jgi:hypothetical protein
MTDQTTNPIARCPKCGSHMELVVIVPHAVTAAMERHTYLCTPCNQVKIYMLPVK